MQREFTQRIILRLNKNQFESAREGISGIICAPLTCIDSLAGRNLDRNQLLSTLEIEHDFSFDGRSNNVDVASRVPENRVKFWLGCLDEDSRPSSRSHLDQNRQETGGKGYECVWYLGSTTEGRRDGWERWIPLQANSQSQATNHSWALARAASRPAQSEGMRIKRRSTADIDERECEI